MDIDVTKLVQNIAPMDYSASIAEIGFNAGPVTWAAACEDALELFGDQFERESFDGYFRDFGAWDDAELAAHTDRESAALMLQFIAGDIREAEIAEWGPVFSAGWWHAYEASDQVSSRFGRGDDGRIYYYIGN